MEDGAVSLEHRLRERLDEDVGQHAGGGDGVGSHDALGGFLLDDPHA